MGLDISSKSKHGYHASYSGIHYARWHAYKFCGGENDYATWMGNYHQVRSYDWSTIVASVKFKNLLLHSDCGGDYSLTGAVDPMNGDLQHGNSRELLAELELLASFVKKCRCDIRHDTFWMLLKLVSDVVRNHDGYLSFC